MKFETEKIAIITPFFNGYISINLSPGIKSNIHSNQSTL